MKKLSFFLCCVLLVAGCSKDEELDELGHNPNAIIEFEDAFTHDICVKLWDTNGDGELSYGEAAAVKSIGQNFAGFNEDDSITTDCCEKLVHFKEFAYFTGITSIPEWAFHYCKKLETIEIPKNVIFIEAEAFYNCESLKSIMIPDAVTTIEKWAFAGCKSLTNVTIGNGVTTIGEGAFFRCDLTSITIPDSVTTIGVRAFYWCSSLTSVTIGKGVTTIGGWAFSDCYSLTAFDGKFATADKRCLVVDGVLVAFAPNGLSEYRIPDGVTTIEGNAFYDCDCLTSVTIPDSVTTIEYWAFYWCSSLTSIYCKPTTPPTLDDSTAGNPFPYDSKIYVPRGSVDAYKSANVWSDYASQIVGYDF